MSLTIKHPGFYSSLQDTGRYDGMSYGIPISGAMDLNLFAYANMVLDNENTGACLEFYQQGLQVEFQESTFVCVAAIDAIVSLNGSEIQINSILKVKAGDVLKVLELTKGSWGYLAVKNGFISTLFFGSQSFYKALTSQQLKKDDELSFEPFIEMSGGKPPQFDLNYYDTHILEVFRGPDFHKLSQTLQYQLFNAEFSLSTSLNRMAYQIQETLENELEEIITGPVLPGTIQYTSGGKMIILMRDAQVTGGYPRILQLSEQAINQLAQMRAKTNLGFKLIEINSETI